MTTTTQAPVLSTSDTHIFEDPTPVSTSATRERYSDEELWRVYEIERTAREVVERGYRRVALQFPDGMLRDAPGVVGGLEREVRMLGSISSTTATVIGGEALEKSFNALSTSETSVQPDRVRFYILADTSYGSCCVDEIAAEHADADVVVHYGRSCLSPTARLPVIYVFTTQPLDIPAVVASFEATYRKADPEKDEKVVLMADITYHIHVTAIHHALVEKGWMNILVPEIVHDPSSLIPNRKIDSGIRLKEYSLLHIGDPPDALLLTLSSRLERMFIYPTSSTTTSSSPPLALEANTTRQLRRRYALVTSLSTCPIFGILINTLSVKNYLSTVSSIQNLIARSGKKSYTFVVGKVNAAKIANFSEIGGWVVVGCWESSLVESRDFYKPIITPYELSLALQSDDERVWDGSWEGDFSGFSRAVKELETKPIAGRGEEKEEEDGNDDGLENAEDDDEEEESAPPEFDLRTGRYVSHSRPMRKLVSSAPPSSSTEEQPSPASSSTILTRRAKGELATINGAVSPGAEYLRTQRTWTGLGSDFDAETAPDSIEEGRGGVARGYTVGENSERT